MRLSMRWMAVAAFACIFSSVRAQDPVPAASAGILGNPGFEEPENGVGQPPDKWTFFTSKANLMALSDEAARTGKQSLKITAQKVQGAFQGQNSFMDVADGEKYTFTAYVMNNRKDPAGGTAHGMLVIEWKAADGREIARTLSQIWQGKSLSRLRWEQLSISKIKVPEGAVPGVFGIHFCEGASGGQGSIFVDDMSLERN